MSLNDAGSLSARDRGDQGERHVDASRHARRGPDRAISHPTLLTDRDAGKPGELVQRFPVGGRRFSLKKPGLVQEKSAAADRKHMARKPTTSSDKVDERIVFPFIEDRVPSRHNQILKWRTIFEIVISDDAKPLGAPQGAFHLRDRDQFPGAASVGRPHGGNFPRPGEVEFFDPREKENAEGHCRPPNAASRRPATAWSDADGRRRRVMPWPARRTPRTHRAPPDGK